MTLKEILARIKDLEAFAAHCRVCFRADPWTLKPHWKAQKIAAQQEIAELRAQAKAIRAARPRRRRPLGETIPIARSWHVVYDLVMRPSSIPMIEKVIGNAAPRDVQRLQRLIEDIRYYRELGTDFKRRKKPWED